MDGREEGDRETHLKPSGNICLLDLLPQIRVAWASLLYFVKSRGWRPGRPATQGDTLDSALPAASGARSQPPHYVTADRAKAPLIREEME